MEMRSMTFLLLFPSGAQHSGENVAAPADSGAKGGGARGRARGGLPEGTAVGSLPKEWRVAAPPK
eukprot:11099782-Lingulodinium_polyedra.AAC.1